MNMVGVFILVLLLLSGCVNNPGANNTLQTSTNATPETNTTQPVEDNTTALPTENNTAQVVVEQNNTQSNLTQPQPIPEPEHVQSLVGLFGIKTRTEPDSTRYTVKTSYSFPGCKAQLVYGKGECLPGTTEGGGYVNTTWCDNEEFFTLSMKCPGESVSSIKYSILSDQEEIAGPIRVYLPARVDAITVKVYDNIGDDSIGFVYTNHADYPPRKGTELINNIRVFCADEDCLTMYAFQTPARYLITSGKGSLSLMNQLLSDNPSITNPLELGALSHISTPTMYGFNHGIRVCVNPYNVVIADPTQTDILREMSVIDSDSGPRIYTPISYFKDDTFWHSPKVIGTQLKMLTGEYDSCKSLTENKYSICSSSSSTNCVESCSADNALILGECNTDGTVPLLSKLGDALTLLRDMNPDESLSCLTLMDELGTQKLVGEKINSAVAFSRIKSNHTIHVFFFNTTIEPSTLNRILSNKYSYRDGANVARVNTIGSCTEYRYNYGFATTCDINGLNVLGFTNCERRDECRPDIDWFSEKLNNLSNS